MATFGQMLARYQGAQRLSQQQSKAQLGIAGEEEKQDIKRARSDYQTAVEKEEKRLRDDTRKRSRRKLIGKAITIGTSFIPGVGKFASAAIGAGLDYAASESVGNYKGFIKGTLGAGLFNKGAREDYEADIASTNSFFQEAYDSQKTANFISALTAGIGQYGQYDAIKGFVDDIPGTRLIDKLSGGDKFVMPESPDLKDLLNLDESSLLNRVDFDESLIDSLSSVDLNDRRIGQQISF
jgi:hypothetical protein